MSKKKTIPIQRLDEELAQISIKFTAIPIQAEEAVGQLLRNSGNEIRNTIIRSMSDSPPDPSKRYKRTKGGKYHNPSFPGNAPRRDSGRLVASIQSVTEGNDIRVGALATANDGVPLKYAKWLEFGTKKLKPRPWLQPAVDKVLPKMKKEANNLIDKIIGNI